MAEVVKNASGAAFEFLESIQPGAYEAFVAYILDSDGLLVQDKDFLLGMIRTKSDTLHIVFAYGDLQAMRKFARVYCPGYGIEFLSWSRDLVSKHSSVKTYKAVRFYGK